MTGWLTAYITVLLVCTGQEGCAEIVSYGAHLYTSLEECKQAVAHLTPPPHTKYKCRATQVQALLPERESN